MSSIVVAACTVASAHAEAVYKVDMTVSQNGAVVGKPSIRVVAGKVADLTMTPPSGQTGAAVRVSLAVSPAPQPNVVGVHVMIFDKVHGEWSLRAAPDVMVKLDEDAGVKVGVDDSHPTSTSVAVDFRVSQASS